ncbi:MAG: flagellar motor switch protein FliG [Planctomycetota bacterium]
MSEAGKPVQMSGLRKAAILMVSLEPDDASKVLAQLDKDQIEQVSKEIAQMDNVNPDEKEKVIEEFYQLVMARQYVEQGGIGYARKLLEMSLTPEEASSILASVEQAIQSTPFQFLQKAESENLLTFIQDEHPQTVALILAHLGPSQAAEVLAGLAPKRQIEVVRRIANMEQTNPDIIKEVEKGLEVRLSAIINQKFEKAGGVESVSEILNLADRSTEKGILESLEEDDPDLVEQIRRLMFVFEDIMLVDDKGVQQVLKEIEQEDLGLALKTASDELKEKIFRNMSERAATLIREDMEYMGPVRISDVEAAQQKIVDVVRRLEDAGEIIIHGRGGEEDIVV